MLYTGLKCKHHNMNCLKIINKHHQIPMIVWVETWMNDLWRLIGSMNLTVVVVVRVVVVGSCWLMVDGWLSIVGGVPRRADNQWGMQFNDHLVGCQQAESDHMLQKWFDNLSQWDSNFIKNYRTDTTLDLSYSAEKKVCFIIPTWKHN